VDVTVSVDTKAWEDSLDLFLVLAKSASKDASVEAAHAIEDETQRSLTSKSHAPRTRTPSAPGDPPAAISTDLAVSVVVDESPADGEAEVGPTTDYGRIQELGGHMTGHPYMRWVEDGRVHYSRGHDLPARPYLLPATEFLISTGDITAIYYQHWLDAQEAVTSP
jgi:phage gpG-like protein